MLFLTALHLSWLQVQGNVSFVELAELAYLKQHRLVGSA